MKRWQNKRNVFCVCSRAPSRRTKERINVRGAARDRNSVDESQGCHNETKRCLRVDKKSEKNVCEGGKTGVGGKLCACGCALEEETNVKCVIPKILGLGEER